MLMNQRFLWQTSECLEDFTKGFMPVAEWYSNRYANSMEFNQINHPLMKVWNVSLEGEGIVQPQRAQSIVVRT